MAEAAARPPSIDALHASASAGSNTDADPKPTVVLVIGMAGSGKTTLMQRINSHLHMKKMPGYIINLDPAVMKVPYSPNIDIRDTVKYKEVMKQYNLGPNGGILTSLNLFATRFDQVVALCEKKRDPAPKHIVVDTPGQIEIFTWSASGAIITEAFASTFPTCVAFVLDTPRCLHPQTFMSNMLQACSILYKTKLPLILVFNKTDITNHEFAVDWMKANMSIPRPATLNFDSLQDYEAFHEAVQADSSYASTLSRSLSLVLEEFYENLRAVGVSALTGQGMDEFFEAVQAASQEYVEFYLPELEAKQKERAELDKRRMEAEMAKLALDRQQGPGI